MFATLLRYTSTVARLSAAQSANTAAGNGGPDPYTETQLVIAKSSPVLLAALPHVRPAMSVSELRDSITIGSQTAFIISVSAQARDADDAAATANAVAKSYISYIRSPSNPGGAVEAQLLQSASRGTGAGPVKQIVIYAVYGLLGAIAGGNTIEIGYLIEDLARLNLSFQNWLEGARREPRWLNVRPAFVCVGP